MHKCIRRALLLGAMGALLALSFYLFIQPNRFAPAGLGGVGAMVQYRLGIGLGWFTLWANLPLCLLAFFEKIRFKTIFHTPLCWQVFVKLYDI